MTIEHIEIAPTAVLSEGVDRFTSQVVKGNIDEVVVKRLILPEGTHIIPFNSQHFDISVVVFDNGQGIVRQTPKIELLKDGMPEFIKGTSVSIPDVGDMVLVVASEQSIEGEMLINHIISYKQNEE